MLARNPYDAGQRALWHLDKIGSIIDCSDSNSLGPDVELLFAVPARKSFPKSNFPQSVSSEEFGMFGDALSPRSASPASFSQTPAERQFLKITERTKVRFVHKVAVSVFSLDLSPSMNVVDTSFKSVTTGCHLVNSLVRSLELALKSLLDPTDPIPFTLVVTVIAHGVPGFGAYPLVVAQPLTMQTLASIVSTVNGKIPLAIDRLTHWLQQNHTSEQLAGPASCSRTRNACTSLVCRANDVTAIVRDCLTAISLTCSQLGLSKAGVSKSITILTDGVLAHPRKLPYDNVLMHLNFVDVALHILQIGGGFAPWSALGYASDPDLLRLLAASTPTGLFIQDHHLDDTSVNTLWPAFAYKFSALTAGVRPVHTPYKAVTYQSSAALVSPNLFPLSYVAHVGASGLSRREHATKLQGIDEDLAIEISRIDSSSFASSPVRRRVASVDSMKSFESANESGDESTSYLQKSKARPYLYKQYKLPGVSAAQIVQIRAREGFSVEHVASGPVARAAGGLHRVASTGGGLARTSSTSSLLNDIPATAIALAMHWGPVMDVVYEIAPGDEVPDGDDKHVISRSDDQLRIKIYLRMPSGEFFLRFKQQVASGAAPLAATETYFWQMCRQLDTYVESIFQVDDTLAKLTCPRSSLKSAFQSEPRLARQASVDHRLSLNRIAEHSDTEETPTVAGRDVAKAIPKDVSTWHRWFTVRNLFVVLDADIDSKVQRLRHGSVSPILKENRTHLIEEIRMMSGEELSENSRFLCRISSWDQVINLGPSSHMTNALCRGNDAVVARIAGDSKQGSSTDSIAPFVLIDVGHSEADGIVKFTLGFFACCPAMERAAVDEISRRISAGTLVDAPSPIIRAIQSGLLQTGSRNLKRQASRKPEEQPSIPTGMGTGESFYTYDPEAELINRFMLHHAWDTQCPPATVLGDVMASVLTKRLQEGWKCVHEGSTSAIFLHVTPMTGPAVVPQDARPVRFGEDGKMILPRTVSSNNETNVHAIEAKEVSIDWEALLKLAKCTNPSQVNRKSLRGMWMCLAVQHVQQRGEKPFLKCQIWVDRGHPDWNDKPEIEFQEFGESLCAFEVEQVAA